MKISVCIKQVPTREWQPRLNDTKTWIREQDASYEMNEPDAYALEEALRLKEKHGGEVVVCSAGPARVAQVIREALARGADRAIHVEDDGLASADAFVVAAALADAMRDERFDLVLTGLQSDDQGFAQTGVIVAERLGLPHATIIMDVQVAPSTLREPQGRPEQGRGATGSGQAARGLWLPVDPTLNQFPADATHVRLARGGLDKQAAILPLIGRLKMTVVDMELAPGSTPTIVGRPPTDTTPLSIAVPRRNADACCGCWSGPR